MKRLVLIDSHAVIHRAYHALPPLTTPGGEPSNAVYGFTTILLRILRELEPDYIVAAFDLSGPTFRHAAYERYKATRPETPSELAGQFSKVKEVLSALGIPVFEKEGFEADDIIGTIAKKLEPKKNTEVVVVTGDMDTLQLVRPRLKVYSMKKGISETTIYDEKAVKERYGLRPSQLTDLKGLKGDPSDNIPGVRGIGEKTATELIKDFGSIEGVYKALKKGTGKISSAVADKLRTGEEDAKFSKELATINESVPIEFKLDDMRWEDRTGSDGARKLFQKFGFFSLLRRLDANSQRKKPHQQPLSLSASGKETKIKILKSVKELDSAKNALVITEDTLLLIPAFKDGEMVFELSEEFYKSKDAEKLFAKDGWYLHDGKSVVRFLRKEGIELGEIEFDTMLAAYLTSSSGRDFSLPAILAREGKYAGEDVRSSAPHFWDAVEALNKKLDDGKIRRVFEEIDMPASRILAEMEERGILIDSDFLKKLAKKVDGELEILTKDIYELAGGPFNINSPRQISAVLFEKLGIKTLGLRKTVKGGVISTGASELEKLKSKHPIIEKILYYRELTKLKTTYIDVLPQLADSGGRLHTTFNQAVTATGRLSSSDPNLQNIPILSAYGAEVRKAFVASPGYILASFDYSQIELRVAAHLADDKKMILAFRNGEDIHKLTASEIYNVPLEKVTSELRRAAKTLNFGVLYGMGPNSFAESTGMSREEARKFIDEYFHDFLGVKNYIERTKESAEKNGYVETLFGRRRYIPEIHSSNWQLKREAERMAINMPIQGTATGDIIKRAMIGISKWIKKEKLEDDVRLLLQVHDELLFEIKESFIKETVPQIKKIMEGAAELKVPLVVDVKIGPNWGEQHAVGDSV